MDNLHVIVSEFVYRIYDPETNSFCQSAAESYGKKRSVWPTKSGATLALKNMPGDVRDRLVIKKFRLEEV